MKKEEIEKEVEEYKKKMVEAINIIINHGVEENDTEKDTREEKRETIPGMEDASR